MKLKNIIKIGSFVVAGTLPTTSQGQAYIYMCQSCPAGTYSDGTQTQCTTCPAGTYSNGGAGSCTKCKPGTYSTGGAGQCSPCPSGQYNNTEGATSCQKCSGGTYAGGTGNTSCSRCPAGKYSKAGSSECQTCGAGTYSTGGAGSCSSCSQPTYSGWSSGSCGVTATRTKTTYCNASGNTSATANPSNSTESKYNGDCPKCKVQQFCEYATCDSQGRCGGNDYCPGKIFYVDIGTKLTSYEDDQRSSIGYGKFYSYRYELYYTNGMKCYSSLYKGCTCQ